MTDMWLGYAQRSARREVLMALRRLSPGSAVVFAESAEDLRERLRDEEPGTVGAIVGHTDEGVSEMNLAAALVRDGLASEVVLVARGASGSLRSRASRAGITRVVDASAVPPLEPAVGGRGPAGTGQADGRDDFARLPSPEQGAASERKVPVTAPLVAERPAGEPVGQESSPILTVVSGRGGVGKTALMALMAGVASCWGMSVALVDLDLSCGNLHSCFGLAKGSDLARIMDGDGVTNESMGRAGVRCADHLQLWGPCERPEMAEVAMPHVASLLSYLSSRFDLVLVDTSTTFTDAVAQAVQACDRLLVVHDERAGAIASASRMSALAVRLGVARTRIVRVANLADPRAKARAFEGRGEVGFETARLYRIVDGGIEAEELLAQGKTADLVNASSDLMDGVSGLLAQTLVELGRLPDDEAAQRAAQRGVPKRRGGLFGRRREVA